MGWKYLIGVLMLALVVPVAASGKQRRKKSYGSMGWHSLNNKLEYSARPDRTGCQLLFRNASSAPISFFEFEFSFVDPKTNEYRKLRRMFSERMAPGRIVFQGEWRATTTNCRNVTVRLNSSR